MRKIHQWPRNVRKRKLNSGEAYTNSTGNHIKAKSLQPACGEKCKQKCSSKISIQDRELLLSEFWALGNKRRQQDFIGKHIASLDNTRRRMTGNRSQNNAYYFHVDSKKIRVCKIFFKATLNVSDTAITTVLRNLTSSGFVNVEKRGTHGNRPRNISDDIKAGIRNHINLFPRIESHYLRAQTTRIFGWVIKH